MGYFDEWYERMGKMAADMHRRARERNEEFIRDYYEKRRYRQSHDPYETEEPPLRVVSTPEQYEWGDSDADKLLKEASKYWPVLRPRHTYSNASGGWLLWLTHLRNRHNKFNLELLRILSDGSMFCYGGIPLIGVIPKHLYEPPSYVASRREKKRRRSPLNILVQCIRESEFVEFEEVK